MYRVVSLTSPTPVVSLVPGHMIPHEGLVWANRAEEIPKLERISLYVSPGAAGSQTVHGMRAEYVRNYWEPKRYVGLRRNMRRWDEHPSWPENQTISLEVDGPGGELIDEIAVARSNDALAIKVSKACFLSI